MKVRDAPVDDDGAAEALAEQTGAHVAQRLGHTLLLFKRREEDSKFDFG